MECTTKESKGMNPRPPAKLSNTGMWCYLTKRGNLYLCTFNVNGRTDTPWPRNSNSNSWGSP
jgi:hypothetical protein